MAFAEQAITAEEGGLVINAKGAAPIVLVCEHATNLVPPEFNALGLDAETLQSHIAWDPGALAVARFMSERLDAPLVVSTVSRLLHDVNRPPGSESACPATSEKYEVPGNRDLSEAQRLQRAERFYFPFHRHLEAVIARQCELHAAVALVTIHSFVPVFNGVERQLDLGLIYDADQRLADRLFSAAGAISMRIGRNTPYGPVDGVTHTLATHALPRGLPNVMLEIRNDLIAAESEQRRMAELLSECVIESLAGLVPDLEAGEHHHDG